MLGLLGNRLRAIVALSFLVAAPWFSSCAGTGPVRTEETLCPAKNSRIRDIRVLQPEGARPRFSPSGDLVVFDRRNPDGYFDVYLSDLEGNIVGSLTEGKEGIGQKNNGNAVFHPGGAYVVFLSEEEGHYLEEYSWSGDPGIGLFCNLWATDPEGSRFYRLTDLPMKRGPADKTPVTAITNPLFSPDGSTLFWTERFDQGGRWGKWRIKAARFRVENGTPALGDERVVFTPARGNYVTAMGFLSPEEMVVAGNLDGRHEYGMDQYIFNLETGELRNLTRTPEYWEEESSVTPGGKIVFMSNADSGYRFDFGDPAWWSQPMERDYYLMDPYGGGMERLTYFNDPQAPEYRGGLTLAVAADISPDGRMLAATLADGSGRAGRDARMTVLLCEFAEPL